MVVNAESGSVKPTKANPQKAVRLCRLPTGALIFIGKDFCCPLGMPAAPLGELPCFCTAHTLRRGAAKSRCVPPSPWPQRLVPEIGRSPELHRLAAFPGIFLIRPVKTNFLAGKEDRKGLLMLAASIVASRKSARGEQTFRKTGSWWLRRPFEVS